MRVDKVLEERQIGSRKTVKRLIQQKRVKVDGIAITNGSFNVEQAIHQLTVDDDLIAIPLHRYYMLHKPNGVVTAKTDANCQTIFDLIADDDQNDQLYPVGRLDRDTEGMLLITDNGQLGYQLLLPDKKVEKVYEATINDIVTEADITAFAEGIVFIGGEKCLPAKLEILSDHGIHSQVRVTIQEGKFHQVKKMFLACGKKLVYLKRVEMGPLVLDPHLRAGDYRPLTTNELLALKPYFRYKTT